MITFFGVNFKLYAQNPKSQKTMFLKSKTAAKIYMLFKKALYVNIKWKKL